MTVIESPPAHDDPSSAGAEPPTRMRSGGLLWRTVRGGGAWTPVLAVAALVEATAAVLLPAVLSKVVDTVLSGYGGALPVILFAGLAALSATAEIISEFATGATAARATARMRRTLLHHVLSAGPASGFGPGDLAGRFVSGSADAGIAPAAVIMVAVAALPPVGAVGALFLIDWRMAGTLVLALPLIALLLRAFVKDTADAAHGYLTVQGRIAARLAGALRGVRTIAAAQTAERETDRILAELPELRGCGQTMWRTQGVINARGLLTMLSLQIVVLAVAALELWAGRISIGELIATTQYAALATGLGAVIGQLVQLGRARAAVTRAAEVLAVPAPGHGDDRPPPGPGTLEFRGVAAGEKFQDLDLTVPGGRAVAVVGRSGSGRSLLTALAGRLRDPERGEVLLDGVPLPRLSRQELRSAVGYAFARPALFGDTIADAIGFGFREPTAEHIRAAAVTACADPFVQRLPEGYATALDDAPMSGGELQRLGLARAFAHVGRVLILDDATSSLDTATEAQITEAILGEMTGCTRLIIAQRAATAARSDLVVWLDDGRVRAVQAHDVLWADPDYRSLFGVDGK